MRGGHALGVVPLQDEALSSIGAPKFHHIFQYVLMKIPCGKYRIRQLRERLIHIPLVFVNATAEGQFQQQEL